MADYNSDRTGSNIDFTLDKVDALDAKVQPTATGVDVKGDVSFYEDTGTTAKMVWDASAESLGIGTASPSENLHIRASSAPEVLVQATSANSASSGRFVAKEADANGHGSGFRYDGDTNTASLFGIENNIDNDVITWSRAGSQIEFKTNGSERARIDGSGTLLVGKSIYDFTTQGTYIAATGQIAGVKSSGAALALNRLSTDGDIAQFYKDTVQVGAIGTNGDDLLISNGDVGIRFFDSNNAIIPRKSAGVTSDGLIDLGLNVHRFKDLYLSGGVRALASETGTSLARHRFGYEPTTQWCAVYKADSANDGNPIVFLNSSATIVGSIATTTSGTSYNTSSDYRLKENVSEIQDASSRVMALKPCRFNFTVDPDKTVDGFLAHEAQEVVPEAVHGTKDGMRDEEYEVTPAVLDDDGNVIEAAVMGEREVPDYQGIDQSKLVPLLTKALQEALERIEILESK